jgi:predicted amidophosphoribosyltransferase
VAGHADNRGRGTEGFVWPPRPVVLDATPPRQEPDEIVTDEPTPVGGTGWAAQAEADFLGLRDVAWAEAARRAGWTPDEAGSVCPRCGTNAGPFEADSAGCPACRRRRLAWSRCVRLGSYEGVLREAVLAAKFTAWRRVGQELGAALGRKVEAELRAEGIEPSRVVVCPVATSRRRRLSRGVDHTVVLAREVARATGGRLVRGLRRSHRPAQTGLSHAARRRNVAGSFSARPRACRAMAGRVVVLVDDVRTTGATLSAAARAIREGVRRVGGDSLVVWSAVAGVTPRGSGDRREGRG